MATDFRQFDEHGFPIAPRFQDLKVPGEEVPRRPNVSVRTKRLVLVAVLLGIVVPVIFGPQIVSAVGQGVAEWFSSRAEQKFWHGDYAGAISDLGHAIGWSPHSWELYFRRAQYREKVDDLNGSLADWNQLLGLTESTEVLSFVYSGRSWIYVRLERYREALDDATHAVRLSPTPENLNTRAYIRALANLELPEGLVDINKALEEVGEGNPQFLDTRGYLLFLMDRSDDSLKDLKRAILLSESDRRRLQTQQFMDPREWTLRMKEMEHNLAVMYHHRGLVYDKLGHKDDADHDLRHAQELGYNPAQGVL
ncbi:MAG TPA: tetratricopeptide repeat protein [Pirellulales bacterium]|nr:tetratricopeptide repeat protein [Pirellulales bacterium]